MSLGHCRAEQASEPNPDVVDNVFDFRDVEVGSHVDIVRAHVPLQSWIDCWVSETATVHQLGLVALGESGYKLTSIPKGGLCVVVPARPPWEDVGRINAGDRLGVVNSQGAYNKPMTIGDCLGRHRGCLTQSPYKTAGETVDLVQRAPPKTFLSLSRGPTSRTPGVVDKRLEPQWLL